MNLGSLAALGPSSNCVVLSLYNGGHPAEGSSTWTQSEQVAWAKAGELGGLRCGGSGLRSVLQWRSLAPWKCLYLLAGHPAMPSAAPQKRHAVEELAQLSLLKDAAGAPWQAQEALAFQQRLRAWLHHDYVHCHRRGCAWSLEAQAGFCHLLQAGLRAVRRFSVLQWMARAC